MEILLLLALGGAALYLLSRQGSGAVSPGGQPGARNYPIGSYPPGTVVPPGYPGTSPTDAISSGSSATKASSSQLLGIGLGGVTTGLAGVSSASSAAAAGETGLAASATFAAVSAGIGVVIGIGLVLWKAHLVRVKQATSENSAVNLGVAGFDNDLRQLNQAFNSGATINGQVVDLNVAIQVAQQILQQYWILVGKYIQPGRNGCSTGQNCQQVIATGNSLIAQNKDSCNDYPGQAIGAACCVGCFSLHQAIYGNADGSIPGVVVTLQHGGGVTHIPQVFASKYGGNNRPAYDLTWRQP